MGTTWGPTGLDVYAERGACGSEGPPVRVQIPLRGDRAVPGDLLHVAARIIRSGRRIWLRLPESWPWVTELTLAFTRLAALPRPGT